MGSPQATELPRLSGNVSWKDEVKTQEESMASRPSWMQAGPIVAAKYETKGRYKMPIQLPVTSTHFSFPMSMWKCAIALLCCAFSIEPLFAQTLNWAYNGADLSNSRYADIDLINPSNVSELKLAWSFTGATTTTGTEAVSVEATPLVVDGVMYINGSAGGVFALNATTGKQIWHYSVANTSGSTRGVAYGQGMIFAGSGANLVALDAKTGALVWKTLVDSNAGAAVAAAPQFVLASNGTQPEVIARTYLKTL
jgi:outer membrane protein assembly factor BamB